jgi:uncharacterized protein (DUF58 family)
MIFLGIFSLIVGLIVADFQFVVLAMIIFTFFILIVLMPRPDVMLERETSNPMLFENNDLRVNLNIQKIRGGYGLVEVYDRIPKYSMLRGGINDMVYNPAAKVPLKYHIQFPLRGYYSVGPTITRISDHFNYFYQDHELLEKETVTVFPRTAGMKQFNLKSKRYIHFPGDFLTRQPGTSTEFYNIRDYIKGDPFKKINWKVYARKRQLMVNEYEKENICDTVIFLDARSFSNIGTIIENPLETGIKLTMSISNFLILHRNQIGLVVYNDQVKVLPPKQQGLKQREEIIRFLTGIYSRGWTEFNIALYYARTYVKTKTTIILISNLEYDRSLMATLEELVAFNHKIMILTPTSIDYELMATDEQISAEKIKLVKLTRENYLTRLRGLGITIIEIGPEDALESIVRNVTKEILR